MKFENQYTYSTRDTGNSRVTALTLTNVKEGVL